MIKQSNRKSKLLYLVANIVVVLISYFSFKNIYSKAEAYEEIVKKGSGYVKLVTYNYGPALTVSLITLISLLLLLALLYRKTNIFMKLEIKLTLHSLFSKENSSNFKNILSIENLSPVLAVKYLYRLALLIIIIRFLISFSSIISITSFGFMYSIFPRLTGSMLTIFSLVLSLVFTKLVFVLLHNIFLLIEKKLNSID